MIPTQLGSFCISRRAVAATVFDGTNLEYTVLRHLPSDSQKAQQTLIVLIRKILDQFQVGLVALEQIEAVQNRRAKFMSEMIDICRNNGIPFWLVPLSEALKAYGFPALRSRKELCDAALRLWPILQDKHSGPLVQQAAAVGLYVQTERLLAI